MIALLTDQPLLAALSALLGLGAVFGALLGFAAIRFRVEGNPISEQINALLPQTQCGQCGYPGCRPYSEAIADGDAINKCPPAEKRPFRRWLTCWMLSPSRSTQNTARKRSPSWPGFARQSALAAPSAFKPARSTPSWGQRRSCIPSLQTNARVATSVSNPARSTASTSSRANPVLVSGTGRFPRIVHPALM